MTAAFSPDVQLFGEASGPASRGAKVAALHLHESLLMEFEKLFDIRDKDRDRSKWRRLLNMKKPKK